MLAKPKKIIVTGSSKGIGLAIAKKLKEEGHLVIINGRNKSRLLKIKNNENFFDYVPGDISKINEAKKVIKNSIHKLKGLDILVCNAGESKSCLPNEENFKDWQKMFQQNFFTASNMIEVSKKFLIKSKGSIICISSICGNEMIQGAPITYSTAKAALNFYIKSLSHYLSKKNVNINLVSPGNILFSGSVWDKKIKQSKSKVKNMLETKVPLKKLGNLEDIVNIVSYLASEKSNYITGSNFIIDGGQTVKL